MHRLQLIHELARQHICMVERSVHVTCDKRRASQGFNVDTHDSQEEKHTASTNQQIGVCLHTDCSDQVAAFHKM